MTEKTSDRIVGLVIFLLMVSIFTLVVICTPPQVKNEEDYIPDSAYPW